MLKSIIKTILKAISLLLIAASWALIALNCFYLLPSMVIFIEFGVFFFLTLIIMAFSKQFFVGNRRDIKAFWPNINNMRKHFGIFAYPLLISTVLLFISSIGIFFTLFYYGGGPEIVDGAYCIVNHGNIVRGLSGYEYNLLSILENQMFISFPANIFSETVISLCNPKNLIQCNENNLIPEEELGAAPNNSFKLR